MSSTLITPGLSGRMPDVNDLGWKHFNALFPRTLESFARRFAIHVFPTVAPYRAINTVPEGKSFAEEFEPSFGDVLFGIENEIIVQFAGLYPRD